MLRRIEHLYGYTVRATDGDIGKVRDAYFDDKRWVVRYLKVDTSLWQRGPRILISPAALVSPDWENKVLLLSLTREQIASSPQIDTERPITREEQAKLHEHYGWSAYWQKESSTSGPGVIPFSGRLVDSHQVQEAVAPITADEQLSQGEAKLLSVGEVTGYNVFAQDSQVGILQGFLADDADWAIRYLVVDTKDWLSSGQILISTQWVTQIGWPGPRVHVDVGQESVRASPEYDENVVINREYETALYKNYDRLGYWV